MTKSPEFKTGSRVTDARLYAYSPELVACNLPRFTNVSRQSIVRRPGRLTKAFGMEITKALAALRQLYGKANIEIVTRDGNRVRGIVRSMKTTQALTTPSVKVERADGELVKIPFSAIVEIIDHNPPV